MHDNTQFVPFKIDAIISQPETVQCFAFAFQFSESFQLSAHHFLRETSKLPQDVQLQFLGHSRQFARAGGIKDDLKRTHSLSLVARTGIAPVFQP